MWGRFVCWLLAKHSPMFVIREKPRREIAICARCGEDLEEDPWNKDNGKGPKRAA
jgi:hypothetical protein